MCRQTDIQINGESLLCADKQTYKSNGESLLCADKQTYKSNGESLRVLSAIEADRTVTQSSLEMHIYTDRDNTSNQKNGRGIKGKAAILKVHVPVCCLIPSLLE